MMRRCGVNRAAPPFLPPMCSSGRWGWGAGLAHPCPHQLATDLPMCPSFHGPPSHPSDPIHPSTHLPKHLCAHCPPNVHLLLHPHTPRAHPSGKSLTPGPAWLSGSSSWEGKRVPPGHASPGAQSTQRTLGPDLPTQPLTPEQPHFSLSLSSLSVCLTRLSLSHNLSLLLHLCV